MSNFSCFKVLSRLKETDPTLPNYIDETSQSCWKRPARPFQNLPMGQGDSTRGALGWCLTRMHRVYQQESSAVMKFEVESLECYPKANFRSNISSILLVNHPS